jgi:hypothetical protein
MAKTNQVSRVRLAAALGKTVLLHRATPIHGALYDVLNQRHRVIRDDDGTHYFAYFAIGRESRSYEVSPNFQCLVILSEEEFQKAPLPFKNRFEKFIVNQTALLASARHQLPPVTLQVVDWTLQKVRQAQRRPPMPMPTPTSVRELIRSLVHHSARNLRRWSERSSSTASWMKATTSRSAP